MADNNLETSSSPGNGNGNGNGGGKGGNGLMFGMARAANYGLFLMAIFLALSLVLTAATFRQDRRGSTVLFLMLGGALSALLYLYISKKAVLPWKKPKY